MFICDLRGAPALRATTVSDYGELLDVLRGRVRELDVSFATVDATAGLPERYVQKLMGVSPSKCFGPISLGCVLGALGLRLIVVEDPEQLAKVRDRLVPREAPLPASSFGMPSSAPQKATGETEARPLI